MDDNAQCSRLEHLPNETLLDICRYLSYAHLFKAFANLASSRFRALVLAAQPLVVLTENADLSIIEFFMEYASNLKVNTDDFYRYDLSRFVNIRFLKLGYISNSCRLDLSVFPQLDRLHAMGTGILNCVFNKDRQSLTVNTFRLNIFDSELILMIS